MSTASASPWLSLLALAGAHRRRNVAACKLADQVRRAGPARPAATLPDGEEPPGLRGLISDLHAATEIHAP
jgi:hypothetical protein